MQQCMSVTAHIARRSEYCIGSWQSWHEEHSLPVSQVHRPKVVLFLYSKEVVEVAFLPACGQSALACITSPSWPASNLEEVAGDSCRGAPVRAYLKMPSMSVL